MSFCCCPTTHVSSVAVTLPSHNLCSAPRSPKAGRLRIRVDVPPLKGLGISFTRVPTVETVGLDMPSLPGRKRRVPIRLPFDYARGLGCGLRRPHDASTSTPAARPPPLDHRVGLLVPPFPKREERMGHRASNIDMSPLKGARDSFTRVPTVETVGLDMPSLPGRKQRVPSASGARPPPLRMTAGRKADPSLRS